MPPLRVFDVVFQTRYGTRYNSYLIQADKPTLIDSVHATFTEEHIAKLKSLIDLKDIHYSVVNHTEMDYSGALGDLLREATNAQILSTKTAAFLWTQ